MVKPISSTTALHSLAFLAIVATVALFLWNQNSGQVDFRITDINSLVAAEAGGVHQVSITTTNNTSVIARVVGTNVC